MRPNEQTADGPEFARLDLNILRWPHSDLSYGAKCLYARLVLFASESGIWEGTHRRLGDELGCSGDNVGLLLAQLLELEIVKVRKRGIASAFCVKPFDRKVSFAKLMLDTLRRPISEVPFHSKCLHGLLLYFGRNGKCFPSQKKLAEHMCCSDRHIRNALEDLNRSGFVEWQSRGRTSSRYTVHKSPRIVPSIAPPENCSGQHKDSSGNKPRIVPAA